MDGSSARSRAALRRTASVWGSGLAVTLAVMALVFLFEARLHAARNNAALDRAADYFANRVERTIGAMELIALNAQAAAQNWEHPGEDLGPAALADAQRTAPPRAVDDFAQGLGPLMRSATLGWRSTPAAQGAAGSRQSAEPGSAPAAGGDVKVYFAARVGEGGAPFAEPATFAAALADVLPSTVAAPGALGLARLDQLGGREVIVVVGEPVALGPDGQLQGYFFTVGDVPALIEGALADSGADAFGASFALTEARPGGGGAIGGLSAEAVTRKIDIAPAEVFLTLRPGRPAYLDAAPWAGLAGLVGFVCTLLASIYFARSARVSARLNAALEEAERANRLKSDFLATISHEIRTPMTGVVGMTELLLDTELTERQEAHVRTVLSSGETLLHLIDDILDFSKIEAGKLKIAPERTDLRALVGDLITLHAVKARDKAIEVVLHYDLDTPQIVETDPTRLRQILGNLLSNAVKFTERGHVEVTVEAAETDADGARRWFAFTVKDTGVGIPQEAQATIFEKFRQVDGATTRRFGGTGLGLSICRQLANMMGGEITLESTEGVGSCFTLRAPFRVMDAAPAERSIDRPLAGARILIVDDLPPLRRIVRLHLEVAGATCAEAADGVTAVKALADAAEAGAPFDIAVIDYLMPKLNGLATAQSIRANPRISSTRLVMLTASDFSQAASAREAHIFDAYLPKPLDKTQLVDTLSRVLSAGTGADQPGPCDAAPPAGEAGERSRPRILVVDDARINQMFVCEVLEKEGYRCDVVSNGDEALRAIEHINYGLVLLDCQMPVMDGYEAARRIRQIEAEDGRLGHLPVVALTANALEGDRERCLEAGMDDYMSKPIRRRDLLAKVEATLARAGGEKAAPDRAEAPAEPRAEIKAAASAGTSRAPDAENRPSADEPVDVEAEEEAVVLAARVEARPEPPAAANVDPEPAAQNDAQPADLLDPDAIARAQEILGDKHAAMVECYFEDTASYLKAMRAALSADDLAAFVRAAHSFKSISRQMGAAAASIEAKNLEMTARLARDGGADAAPLAAGVEALHATLARTEEAFTMRGMRKAA